MRGRAVSSVLRSCFDGVKNEWRGVLCDLPWQKAGDLCAARRHRMLHLIIIRPLSAAVRPASGLGALARYVLANAVSFRAASWGQ